MTRLTRPRQRRSEVPKVLMGRLVVGRALPLSAMGGQAVDHLKWGSREVFCLIIRAAALLLPGQMSFPKNRREKIVLLQKQTATPWAADC